MTHISTADFLGRPLSILDYHGKKWLTAEQVGHALGYNEANARQGVNNLFKRHEDEFTEADSFVINLMTNSPGNPSARIFSVTGCVLLSFFSGTARSKHFRAWAKVHLAVQLEDGALPMLPVRQDENAPPDEVLAAKDALIAAQAAHIADLKNFASLHALKPPRSPERPKRRRFRAPGWKQGMSADKPEALRLLRAALDAAPDGRRGVARRLGCSYSYLTRILSENDPREISRALAWHIVNVYGEQA